MLEKFENETTTPAAQPNQSLEGFSITDEPLSFRLFQNNQAILTITPDGRMIISNGITPKGVVDELVKDWNFAIEWAKKPLQDERDSLAAENNKIYVRSSDLESQLASALVRAGRLNSENEAMREAVKTVCPICESPCTLDTAFHKEYACGISETYFEDGNVSFDDNCRMSKALVALTAARDELNRIENHYRRWNSKDGQYALEPDADVMGIVNHALLALGTPLPVPPPAVPKRDVLQAVYDVVDAWMKEYKPVSTESFYQRDSIILALPELGDCVFSAYSSDCESVGGDAPAAERGEG